MRLGIRSRLFLLSFGLITVVVVVSGLFLEKELRDWLGDRVETELLAQARLAAELVVREDSPLDYATASLLADAGHRATGARVTIIRSDGVVLGDSELDDVATRAVENHGGRPEVITAHGDTMGVARRYSGTLHITMLYVAVPFQRPDESGVVRVALPLFEEQAVIHRLRDLLIIAAFLGLIAAILMSWTAAQFTTRRLRDLADGMRTIAMGGTRRRVNARRTDEIGGIAGSFNEIAEQLEQTIATLASERNRFEAVLDSMGEALFALDDRQRITLVNPEAHRLLDLRESPVGKTLLEVVRVPDLSGLVEQATRGEAGMLEFDLEGPPGSRIMARTAPLRATGGSVVVMHDVTELRRLERIRRDFVANVSHELRTPISVIRANAETLLDLSPEGDDLDRLLTGIHRNAERLTDLISDLLDISRLESGSYAPRIEPVDVSEAVENVIRLVADAAQERDQRIEVDVEPALAVQADPRGLDQILLNLVDNAVKYSPAGRAVRIVARSSADGYVLIDVTDRGPGIEPKHRDRLFERFYRVDEGRSREKGGTGLGLAIVKHLTEAMGGQVGYRPDPSGGSIFWISLPIQQG